MFEWFVLVSVLIAGAGIGYEAAPNRVSATVPTTTKVKAGDVPPQTQNLAPIFRCTGAGNEVLVSLGGDGSSVYVWCSNIKS